MINLQFATYLSNLPRTAVTESVTALYNALFESIEGDAGNYFRKLIRSTDPQILRRIHVDVLNEMNNECPDEPEEKWIAWLWNWFRGDFDLRNNDAVYFAPGLARIVICQPDSDRLFRYKPHNELSQKASFLKQLVHYIAIAHKDSYTRFLADKSTGEMMTYDMLVNKFGDAVKQQGNHEMTELESLKYTPNDYVIVELKDFATANKFAKYTELSPGDKKSGWCHTEYDDTFDYYSNNGKIRLYIAYKPGFEKLQPGDKGYGQSMLGIDVGPGNKLKHCNNRYNHDDDPELDNTKNRPGDNRFNAKELSLLLGAPFYQVCPYYNAEERRKLNLYVPEDVEELLAKGEDILKCGYITVDDAWNHWAIIKLGDQSNVLAPDGKSLVFDEWMDSIYFVFLDHTNFNNVKLAAFSGGVGNLFDFSGKPLLDKWYNAISPNNPKSGLITLRDGDRYNCMDKTGKFLFKNWYCGLPRLVTDNIYAAIEEDGKYHFLDKNENEISDVTAEQVRPYSDRYVVVYEPDTLRKTYSGYIANILDTSTGKLTLSRWFCPHEFDDCDGVQHVRVRKEDGKLYSDLLDYQHPDHYLLNDERVFSLHSYDDGLWRVAFRTDNFTAKYNVINMDTHKWLFDFVCDSIQRNNSTGEFEIEKDGKTMLTKADGTFILDHWIDAAEV